MMDKARCDSVEEAERRLPELTALKGNVRDETTRLFVEEVPEYFWLARASKEHHPPDERGLGGLWLHTKRAFASWTTIEPTLRKMGLIDTFEANCARSAVLLHDAFKYGSTEHTVEEETHTYCEPMQGVPAGALGDHGSYCADRVRTDSDLPAEVADLIVTHDGAWFEGRSPDTTFELVHHLADVFSSDAEHDVAVYPPCTELEKMVGDVNTVEEPDEWLEHLHDYV